MKSKAYFCLFANNFAYFYLFANIFAYFNIFANIYKLIYAIHAKNFAYFQSFNLCRSYEHYRFSSTPQQVFKYLEVSKIEKIEETKQIINIQYICENLPQREG
jgi:hypothetical protein